MKFVKGHKLKQCPFCNHWVLKSEGCDHMKCRCGKDFCYKCGGVYMKCECGKQMFNADGGLNDDYLRGEGIRERISNVVRGLI